MDVRYLRGTSTLGAHNPDGDWIAEDQARQCYLSDPGLTVVSAEVRADRTPAWQVRINATGWFRSVFHSESGTPLREVTWEPVEGRLVLRETRDLFYPEGDPGRRVPYVEITSVAREFFASGRARVALRAPGLDVSRTLGGVDAAMLVQPLPAFGEWAALVDGSAPTTVDRFGPAASDAALAFALDDLGGEDVTGAPGLVVLDAHGGWVMEATERQIYEIAVAVANGGPVPYGATVLTRGEARIIPLGVQGDPAKGADPVEEERRLVSLDNDVRGLLAYVAQDPTNFLASWRGWYETEATAVHFDLLISAGVTMARTAFMPPDNRFAVMLVWAGEVERGTRTLALHVVPAHWCNDRIEGEPPRGVDLLWGRQDLAET